MGWNWRFKVIAGKCGVLGEKEVELLGQIWGTSFSYIFLEEESTRFQLAAIYDLILLLSSIFFL